MRLFDRLAGFYRRDTPPDEVTPLHGMAVQLIEAAGQVERLQVEQLKPAVVDQPLYRQTAVGWLFNWLAGIPDPDEVLRRTGRTRADLRQLLRDAEVSQAIDTRRDAVIATPWRIEGGAARGVKFLTAELTPMIERLILGFWDATIYGYSVGEVVYARRGANVGIGDVYFPPFEWFRPLPGGDLRYFPMTGEGGMEGIACDPRKFFLTARNATYRNPFGEALLSALYWPVTWRLQGFQLWLSFLETFGAPIVVGKTGNYQQFVDAMVAQGVTRTIGWQATSDKDEVTTINASRSGEFDALNQCLNETIQRVVLGQTLTSNIRGGGSYAAAKVHNEVRDDKRRADVRMIVGSMQRVVDTLWALNAFPGDPPRYEMQDDVGLELERATRDALLVPMGVRFTPKYMTERYDLELDDFSLTDPTAPIPPAADNVPTPPAKKPVGLAALLGAARFTPEQQAVEQGVAEVLASIDSIIASAEIQAAIRLATSPEDLAQRLAALMPEADATEFETVLSRSLFAADILGYAHAQGGA